MLSMNKIFTNNMHVVWKITFVLSVLFALVMWGDAGRSPYLSGDPVALDSRDMLAIWSAPLLWFMVRWSCVRVDS